MMVHMKILKPIYKILCLHKNPELQFTSKSLIVFQSLTLSFKADDSFAHVNHAQGLEFVQPQGLSHYLFIAVCLPPN